MFDLLEVEVVSLDKTPVKPGDERARIRFGRNGCVWVKPAGEGYWRSAASFEEISSGIFLKEMLNHYGYGLRTLNEFDQLEEAIKAARAEIERSPKDNAAYLKLVAAVTAFLK